MKKYKWLIVLLVFGLLLSIGAGCAKADGHPQLIAHAGGGIYGYRLTNSREAMDEAYDNGFTYIELDFDVTSDGHVVLIHGWFSLVERLLNKQGQLTVEEFTNSDTFLDLTLMTLDDLLDWLKKHPEVSIITDVKSEDNLAVLEQIAAQAGNQVSRFIPQIYDFEQYERVGAMGYSRIILTLYRMNPELETLKEFAASHKLWAVTVDQSRLTEELLGAITSTGPAVYAHTVNDLSFFEGWHEKGLTGIYTDYFQPNHWPEMD